MHHSRPGGWGASEWVPVCLPTVFVFVPVCHGVCVLCWIRDIREYQVVSGIKIRDGGIRGP